MSDSKSKPKFAVGHRITYAGRYIFSRERFGATITDVIICNKDNGWLYGVKPDVPHHFNLYWEDELEAENETANAEK